MKSLFKWRGVNQDEVSLETGIPITSLSRKLNSGVFRYEEMCIDSFNPESPAFNDHYLGRMDTRRRRF